MRTVPPPYPTHIPRKSQGGGNARVVKVHTGEWLLRVMGPATHAGPRVDTFARSQTHLGSGEGPDHAVTRNRGPWVDVGLERQGQQPHHVGQEQKGHEVMKH